MMPHGEMDGLYMALALEEAAAAAAEGEVPVGALIVSDAQIIARAHNRPIALNDPTAHAEILAIRTAARYAGNYRLSGMTLYVTLEPCFMCAGAVIHARIGRVIFGARDPKGGAVVSIGRIFDDKLLNHHVDFTGGIMEGLCSEILSSFFQRKRL
ncbi:MAG: tRNA adenosine(34) deaminase TadA [Syntrophales bacterium]|nr:tRNA adenosine(34) deaminase TadA [Syntrophales bacterium]MCK9390951.1 tRNA adenosine(34) deaminase TadA [Syntrophales bacterium]